MKKIILPLIIIGLLNSCEKKNEPEPENTTNKVLLLKVDFLTSNFEGGKELIFPFSQNFTISCKYESPSDFGSVQLFYSELNIMLFNGTIVWAGTGHVTYPTFDEPSSFTTTGTSVQIPDKTLFENVMYFQYAYYPNTISYRNIWYSISKLKLVKEYRNSNPDGKVYLFLYTPGVGAGNPADYDWFVILKN